MDIRYINLPEDFTVLLQSNMQSSGNGFAYLKKSLWNTASFQSLVSRSCRDLDENLTFEKLITSLGWYGLRDRLAGTYLYHQKHGVFPDGPTIDLVSDILELEDLVKDQTVDGYNRAFLLGFYFKMSLLSDKKNTHSSTEQQTLVPSDVLELLKLVKTKTAHIDWLCLSLMKACGVHGKDRVLKLLTGGGGFASLRSSMNDDQEYQFVRSMLAYGASIGHHEVFHNPTI